MINKKLYLPIGALASLIVFLYVITLLPIVNYYFPHTGLGGVLFVPFYILLVLTYIVLVIYFIRKGDKKNLKSPALIYLSLFSFLIFTFISLFVYPQDSGNSIYSIITTSITGDVDYKYNNIRILYESYDDFDIQDLDKEALLNKLDISNKGTKEDHINRVLILDRLLELGEKEVVKPYLEAMIESNYNKYFDEEIRNSVKRNHFYLDRVEAFKLVDKHFFLDKYFYRIDPDFSIDFYFYATMDGDSEEARFKGFRKRENEIGIEFVNTFDYIPEYKELW
jgi:energy-coupling factor transporter transmembrane protein EcfT